MFTALMKQGLLGEDTSKQDHYIQMLKQILDDCQTDVDRLKNEEEIQSVLADERLKKIHLDFKVPDKPTTKDAIYTWRQNMTDKAIWNIFCDKAKEMLPGLSDVHCKALQKHLVKERLSAANSVKKEVESEFDECFRQFLEFLK
jgi:hypothetical protein